MILFFTVDKQIITRRDNEKVVRDSQNYLYINFSFSEDWTGTKTAVFKGKSGNAFNVLIDENGSCLVPWEVLAEEYFEVSAFCGDLITANVVKVFTIESGYAIGEESRTPTPDIYAQIIARLSAIEAEIDPTAIQQVVDEYLSDKDYVTEQDVEQIVANYVEAHKDELKGDTGATGPQGPQGIQGPKGDPGEGVAPGGTTGQVLIKSSDGNYETEWVDATITASGYTDNLISPSACKPKWQCTTTVGSDYYTDGIANNSMNTTNLIPFEGNNIWYKINLNYLPVTTRVLFYNSNAKYVAGSLGNVSLDTDGYLKFTVGIPTGDDIKYFIFMYQFTYLSSDTMDDLYIARIDKFPRKSVEISDLLLDKEVITRSNITPNILNGKKWAVCGDSFTDGSTVGLDTFADGTYKGQRKVYAKLIADKNNMELQWIAAGGRTLAERESTTNTFAARYTYIASDIDYITMYFGINDSHLSSEIPLGTIADNTLDTFYGAWNVILPYLIEHYPNAKIGILVSNGCGTDDYRTATIECANKWGIPYIDLNGDERTPMMIRSTNPNASSTAKNLRNTNWMLDDNHPNTACHAYEATFIENFLRSL